MLEDINSRFGTLLEEGRKLEALIGFDDDGDPEYILADARTTEFQSWLASSANIIELVAPPGGHLIEQCQLLFDDPSMPSGIPVLVFRKMLGLLISAKQDWDAGLLRRIEYLVAAATFDDFLDHASAYHKGGLKNEAAVLAGATLEDAVKKVAVKNGVNPSGLTLDPLLDKLASVHTITPQQVKRYKAAAGVRNAALHAEWQKFDIDDAGQLIGSTRHLIDNFL